MLGPFGSLALVFALLGVLWILLRRLDERAGAGRHLRVLESLPLCRGSQLSLVRIGERCFLLAATAERVTVIREFDAGSLPHVEAALRGPRLLFGRLRAKEQA